jgi:hypothetical protein
MDKDNVFPDSFRYLRSTASRFGVDDAQIAKNRAEMMDNYTAQDLSELESAYREIDRRGDANALADWILDASPRIRKSKAWRSLFILTRIFGDLADRAIEPFVSRRVLLFDAPTVLDWTKLPVELRYLSGPAETYGIFQFEDDVERAAAKVSRKEKNELAEVARGAKRDLGRIMKWMDRFRMTKYKEAELIHFLLLFLRRLELL